MTPAHKSGGRGPSPQPTLPPEQARAGVMSVRADTAPSIMRGTPPVARTQAPARAAGRGPVVNFDLPPQARLQPEPTCEKPQAFAGGVAIGKPIGTNTRGAEMGLSFRGPVRTHIGSTIPLRHMPPRPKPAETGTIVEGRKHAMTSGSHRHQMKVLDLLPCQNRTLEGSPVHRVRELDQQKVSQHYSCNLNLWPTYTRSRQL